jgi:Na+-transporting NADH:ubiquinone oxidoreductase subunit NqrD
MSASSSAFSWTYHHDCIVKGRLEAFAMGNKPWASFLTVLAMQQVLDGILIVVGFFRSSQLRTVWAIPSWRNRFYNIVIRQCI